jgi:hypothetical protein
MRTIWIGALIALGCTNPSAPLTGLAMTASIESPTLQAGDTVTVTVTIVNRGAEDRTLTASICPLLPFVLTNTAGIEVGQGLVPGGCLHKLDATTLVSGGHVVFSLRWEGSVQKRDSGSAEMLGTGTYLLHPRLVTESGTVTGQSALTIQVLP